MLILLMANLTAVSSPARASGCPQPPAGPSPTCSTPGRAQPAVHRRGSEAPCAGGWSRSLPCTIPDAARNWQPQARTPFRSGRALGTEFTPAHARSRRRRHPLQRRLQRWPLAEASRRHQRHRSRIAAHLLIHHLRIAEGGLLGQQVLHQAVDDRLITELGDRRGVVEVAGDHRSLHRLVASSACRCRPAVDPA